MIIIGFLDMFIWSSQSIERKALTEEVGFRPVVRLKSNVKLITNDGGNTYEVSF